MAEEKGSLDLYNKKLCVGLERDAKNEWAAKKIYDICMEEMTNAPSKRWTADFECMKVAIISPTNYGGEKWFNFCKKNRLKKGWDSLF